MRVGIRRATSPHIITKTILCKVENTHSNSSIFRAHRLRRCAIQSVTLPLHHPMNATLVNIPNYRPKEHSRTPRLKAAGACCGGSKKAHQRANFFIAPSRRDGRVRSAAADSINAANAEQTDRNDAADRDPLDWRMPKTRERATENLNRRRRHRNRIDHQFCMRIDHATRRHRLQPEIVIN